MLTAFSSHFLLNQVLYHSILCKVSVLKIEILCILMKDDTIWKTPPPRFREKILCQVLLDQKLLALVGYLQGLPSGIAGDWPPVDIPPDVCWPDIKVSPSTLLLPVPVPVPCNGDEWCDELEEERRCWWARLTPSCSANSRWSDWCT